MFFILQGSDESDVWFANDFFVILRLFLSAQTEEKQCRTYLYPFFVPMDILKKMYCYAVFPPQ